MTDRLWAVFAELGLGVPGSAEPQLGKCIDQAWIRFGLPVNHSGMRPVIPRWSGAASRAGGIMIRIRIKIMIFPEPRTLFRAHPRHVITVTSRRSW